MTYYCAHCGSANTRETETGNGGDLFVAEELDTCTEGWDVNIIMLDCQDCKATTYVSKGN